MYNVSVIVPVYNVEKYLFKCLDSLVNQTLKEIEIIVVNDGTKDNSQKIIDLFTEKYSNVKGYIKNNGGLADARNFGIRYATGEYIGFIDSDDYIEPEMYEMMYNKARECNSDLVVCDLEYVWENSERSPLFMPGIKSYKDFDVRRCIFMSPLFAWNKIYKKSFFLDSNLEYSVGKWYEDIPVTVPLFALANNIGYVDEVFIHYLQRKSSIMGSEYDPRMYDIFSQMIFIYNYYKKNNYLDEYHEEIEYLFIEHLMLYGAFRFLRTKEYKKMCSKSFEIMNNYFPNYRKNKYINVFSLKNRVFIKTLTPLTIDFYKMIIERR